MDRKKFERDKKMHESRKANDTSNSSTGANYFYKGQTPDFFKGVNNILGLKKRYRDLLKIFHPDNLCGDNDTVLEINRQYEALKKKMGIR